MKTQVLFAILFAISPLAAAQNEQAADGDFCSMVFVNATSAESLELSVDGKIWYPDFTSGQKTGAGKMPRLDWPITLRASNATDLFEFNFQAEQAASYIAVILGDFQIIPMHDESGEVSKQLRGDIKFFPANLTPEEQPNRIRIVNGMIETTISVPSAEGKTRTLGFAEYATFDGMPTRTTIPVQVGEEKKDLSFLFVPPETGSTVVFYDGKGSSKMVVANEVIMRPDGSRPVPEPEEIERVLREEQSESE